MRSYQPDSLYWLFPLNFSPPPTLQGHTLSHKPSKQHGKGLERTTKLFSDEWPPNTGSQVELTSNRDKLVDIGYWLEQVRIQAEADKTF